MKLRGWIAALAAVGMYGACSSDEAQRIAPAEVGARGESCQARNDCVEGLACILGVCTQNEYPISPDARECELVQCTTNEDCCVDFTAAASCPTYEQYCLEGDTYSCELYNAACICSQVCVNESCVTPSACTEDIDCYSTVGAGFCRNGGCVDCVVDLDCYAADARCVNNMCESPCLRNEHCAFFEECQGGQCVEVGCRDKRECIFRYDQPLMECDIATGQCYVPCESDAACPGEFQVCDGGRCLFMGCTSDEQCRIYFNLQNTTGPVHAVCR